MTTVTSTSGVAKGAAYKESTGSGAGTAPVAVPDGDASQGAAALTAPTAAGNVASVESPEALKKGSMSGSRSLGVDALKSRLAHIESMLKLDPTLLPKGFRERLLQQKADLTPRLQRAAALDFLAQSAWAAGAPPEIVKALDTAPIKVVPNGSIESEAAFDEENDVILVTQGLLDAITKDIDELSDQEIVDANGDILDPSKLKRSEAFHDLAVTQALFGAHEAGHQAADHEGQNDQAKAAIEPDVQAYLEAGNAVSLKQQGNRLIWNYINNFEFEQYQAQELYQFQMGEAPKNQAWMTIDNTGQPIDRATAVTNVFNFLTSQGFTADSVVAIAGSESQKSQREAQLAAGYEGSRLPGSRLPGDELEGSRLPGSRLPGDELEGSRLPGSRLPGSRLPGSRLPGSRLPGSRLPGKRLK